MLHTCRAVTLCRSETTRGTLHIALPCSFPHSQEAHMLTLTLFLVATYLCVNRQCVMQYSIIRKFSESLVFVLRISLRNDSEGTMRLGAQYI